MVAYRVGVALEYDDPATLAADDAVGAGVEGAAPSGRGQRLHLAHENGEFGRDDHIDATGQRGVGLAVAQRLAGEVDGDERGGAGGVDSHRRAVQPEGVGNASGGEAELLAGGEIGVYGADPGGPRVQQQIVGAENAHVHGGPAALPGAARQARVLHGLGADLQQQPLLRVHAPGLTRRDAEIVGVEPVDLVEESALTAVSGTGVVPVGVVELVAPAVRGHRRDDVHAVHQHPPQSVQVAYAAGEAATDPDDSDVVGAGLEPSVLSHGPEYLPL